MLLHLIWRLLQSFTRQRVGTKLPCEFSQITVAAILHLFPFLLASEISIRKAIVDIQEFPLEVGVDSVVIIIIQTENVLFEALF